tara:strand:- start:5197 stop:6471 length:1275 start_codon:yes stop_codon:yes gene_type:complete
MIKRDEETWHDLIVPFQRIYKGDCLERLKEVPDSSVDSVVCDPPYHLTSIVERYSSENAAPAGFGTDGAFARASRGFMGKEWDGGDIAFRVDVWRECLRVLKPGGHLIAFGGSRTVHRIACAIEDAGFEIRDMISWLYFSGFPKSHNISKAIDRAAGVDRPVIAEAPQSGAKFNMTQQLMDNGGFNDPDRQSYEITAAVTEDAKRAEGLGTALKPAQEPAILARKPLARGMSIAENWKRYGTGALRIEDCRFAYGDPCWVGPQHAKDTKRDLNAKNDISSYKPESGRWPANIYQCPKPSRAEKESGLEKLNPIQGFEAVSRKEGSAGLNNPRAGAGRTASEIRNSHPTVKPVKLMRWLIRLVTPKHGIVLDPFTGSGTTGVAACLDGVNFIGCELTPEYWPIIEGRIDFARDQYKRDNSQMKLF